MVFHQLDLQLKEGEFVTLLGPSGSGKSSLFHLIGGLITPDSGTVRLEGQDITGKKGHISYMPQSPSLLPWRSVIDNVLLGQEIQGERDVRKAEEMLDKAGLLEYKQAYPRELSGGMRQRVAFIRALLSPQPILFLDEPFSALDEWTRQDMGTWLLSIWEEYRKTIFFITHNTEEALLLSDRVLVLSKSLGQIKQEWTIPFPRPRDASLSFTSEFVGLKKEISLVLREDSK